MSPKTPASDTPTTPLRSAGLLSNNKYDFLMKRHERLDADGSLFDDLDVSLDNIDGPQDVYDVLCRVVQLPTQDFLKFMRDRKGNK